MSDHDMSHRLHALTRAVEMTMTTAHGLAHDLLAYHQKTGTVMPPFTVVVGDSGEEESRRTAMAEALAAYGGQPGLLFNLWVHLSALDQLRAVWLRGG